MKGRLDSKAPRAHTVIRKDWVIQNWGYLFWGSLEYDDYAVLGSAFGSPYTEILPNGKTERSRSTTVASSILLVVVMAKVAVILP